ncbi:MAG TPA: hypothetical protein DDW52_02410 [Planctomycetaceae bacterium]|nr:hypothetical protein [Planctomycetaceae bacterium]
MSAGADEEPELREIEHSVDAELPASYREFLKRFGGCGLRGPSVKNSFVGFVPVSPVPITGSKDQLLFEVFYGAPRTDRDRKGRDQYSLLHRNTGFHQHEQIPANMLLIGTDEHGEICLCVKGPDAGKIYYWDYLSEPDWEDVEDYEDDAFLMEYGEPKPVDGGSNHLYLVAESFEDLLERLEPGRFLED